MKVTLKKQSKIAARRAEATKLYFGGDPLRTIAEKLGVSHETIRSDVLADIRSCDESRAMMVQQKREQYAQLLRAHWDAATSGGDIRAATIVLKILEAERKLFGLDEPARQQIEVAAPTETLAQTITDMIASVEMTQKNAATNAA
ncbi:MAG: hypothetical protein ACRC46_01540 [Thermoguttaceae bacterium]